MFKEMIEQIIYFEMLDLILFLGVPVFIIACLFIHSIIQMKRSHALCIKLISKYAKFKCEY